MAKHPGWTREQLLVAFRLYCRTPFGRLHGRNPEIIQLAKLIGRTSGAVAMKACNFASLDPAQHSRGVKALGNLSHADRELWEEFMLNSESIASEAEAAYERLTAAVAPRIDMEIIQIPEGPTEVARTVRSRRVQGFFRSTVLNVYNSRCALTGIAVPALLNASHIIPWNVNTERRADPRNGLCLNVLHDRAFDRGLITFDDHWRVVLSSALRGKDLPSFHEQTLLGLEGHPLQLPDRFKPDPDAMTHHREMVFKGS